jgi:hypothetical protein
LNVWVKEDMKSGKKGMRLGKMNQKIICQRGKCIEEDTIETEMDAIFDSKNIVDQIQRDLLQNMIN